MKGFTLLEIMVALAILAGVILTVITSYNYHLGIVTRDKEETEAMLLARAKLDDPNFLREKQASGNFAPRHPDITWKMEKKPAEIPGVERLTFTVAWDGDRHTLTLAKYQELTLTVRSPEP
ncbi:MAG: type II secretion system protein GspI [Geobacter sp.]|nr:MAG: type II secretion system protein GspI [Geobacter sp.]